ncbi:hypothetical protein BDY24DRAFT_382247, partial [Mrakia frigida]|uniref:uncharacterized protein n=1 Tax=Mrakia frigida TaxID=29902 RepID=UPI003FCBF0BF
MQERKVMIRKGQRVCRAFNAGRVLCEKEGGGRDEGLHVCSLCLEPSHSAQNCSVVFTYT